MKQNDPERTEKTHIDFSPLIMVRFSEIAIKGTKTRKWLTDRLVTHLKYILDIKGIEDARIIKEYSRIFVSTKEVKEAENFISALVPGVASTSIVYPCTSEISDIKLCIKEKFLNRFKKESTFAVKAKRTGKHSYSSVELGGMIGEFILDNSENKHLKVDLSKPQYTLFVEVRDNNAYVFDKSNRGLGGLPVGSQGRVLTLISDNDEDIANIIQLYKRGALTIIYSLIDETNIKKENRKIIDKILQLQPHLKKYERKIIFSEGVFESNHILEIYNSYEGLSIAMSNKVFEEYSTDLPVNIPIFVPHLVVDVDKNETSNFKTFLT